MGAGRDEVVPPDHLAADEAPRDVGVDRGGGIQGGRAVPQRPGPGLGVTGREEDHEIQDGDEPADDVLQCRRAAVSELRRLVGREVVELGLEREVDSVWLRRQRLQLGRKLTGPVAKRALVVDVRDQAVEQLGLGAQGRVARLGVLSDALEPALDVVPVGDEQLKLERRQVVGVADDRKQRVGAAYAAELGGGCFAEPTTSAICGSLSSAIGAIPTCGVP